MTKIKDLSGITNLGNVKVKTPDGVVGYWKSQWQKGVWLHIEGTPEGRVTPIFVEDFHTSVQPCIKW